MELCFGISVGTLLRKQVKQNKPHHLLSDPTSTKLYFI